MRVLILSQYYDPEPVPKAGDLARALKANKHVVQVLTGFPNYPSGKLYAGFDLALTRRETSDGIEIRRSYEFPYHGKRVLGRLLNYASFMCSSVLAAVALDPVDVIYVWHPPLTIGISAWLISRLRGAPFVYDVQDIWPESAVLSGLLNEGRATRLMSRLERFVYRRAGHVLVVTQGAKNNLIGKGVPAEKISVMPHWVDEEVFAPVSMETRRTVRDRYGWGDRFVILFAGNLGMVQGLDTVIEAAGKLGRDSRAIVAIAGDGADKDRLERIAAEKGMGDRVRFLGRKPVGEMPELMAASDALLVHLRRSELSHFVIPTKTLAYLGAARPVIMAMEGAAADMVKSAGAGLLVTPEDSDALSAAVRQLERTPEAERSRMGENGRRYLLANFRMQDVLARYEEVLTRTAQTARETPSNLGEYP